MVTTTKRNSKRWLTHYWSKAWRSDFYKDRQITFIKNNFIVRSTDRRSMGKVLKLRWCQNQENSLKKSRHRKNYGSKHLAILSTYCKVCVPDAWFCSQPRWDWMPIFFLFQTLPSLKRETVMYTKKKSHLSARFNSQLPKSKYKKNNKNNRKRLASASRRKLNWS